VVLSDFIHYFSGDVLQF